MKLGRLLLVPAVFALAAGLSVLAALSAARTVERMSARTVQNALVVQGEDWAKAEADGLIVRLTGMAETEALRFRALSVASSVVDAARVIDAMEVRPAAELRPPDFSVEILRNDDTIQLIGLIPAAHDRDHVVEALADLVGADRVSDMLETANFAVPFGWETALDFGLDALSLLPRSKISIAPANVSIRAITASAAEKARLEAELARRLPDGVHLDMHLSAPRPVITPFTLRFLIDGQSARFDACSADTEASRSRILAAATAAGTSGKVDCTIGLGVPSPHWAEAVEAGIRALAELRAGNITFSDADVSLVAADTVAQENFDRVVGELENALPEVFSLTAVLIPKPEQASDGPPNFTATLSPEGLVQLRGRLTDDRVRDLVGGFAAARFGSSRVYNATRLDPELPMGWPVRVLAALEALAQLTHGSVLVEPGFMRITGSTGNPDANAEVARILAEKLGGGARFEIAIKYVEALDPVANLPDPEDCVADLNAILAQTKITFAPGSADIAGESLATLDQLAEVLRECQDVPMEIGAHSDSQGGEQMNLNLSQSRANSVLNGLLARRVLTTNLTAVGYGEGQPIADNETEEGREANRRIEFTLFVPGEPEPELSAVAAALPALAASGAPPRDPEARTEEPATSEGADELLSGAEDAAAPEGTEGSQPADIPLGDPAADDPSETGAAASTVTELPAEAGNEQN